MNKDFNKKIFNSSISMLSEFSNIIFNIVNVNNTLNQISYCDYLEPLSISDTGYSLEMGIGKQIHDEKESILELVESVTSSRQNTTYDLEIVFYQYDISSKTTYFIRYTPDNNIELNIEHKNKENFFSTSIGQLSHENYFAEILNLEYNFTKNLISYDSLNFIIQEFKKNINNINNIEYSVNYEYSIYLSPKYFDELYNEYNNRV